MNRPALGARDRELLRGRESIIGVDEVGRGSLVGPVVVCGARFTSIPENSEIQDSKSLSPRRRTAAAAWVTGIADGWLVVEVWPEIIDRVNIRRATMLAMESVIAVLRRPASVVVVDGSDLGDHGDWRRSVRRADAQYFSVAAASIVAKVHRDGLLSELALRYPLWGWENNRGYGSMYHRQALEKHGRSWLHRRSFGPWPVLP